jgi:hypothetical protein
MSANWLCLFSGPGYDEYVGRTMSVLAQVGVDQVRVYDRPWLEAHPFRHLPGNRWLFETAVQRGVGWHCWKPLVTLDTMQYADEGDVVLYLDADTWPTGKDLRPLFDQARREEVVLFDYVGHEPQRVWCTGNCFTVMAQNEVKYRDSIHGCARFGLFKVGSWKAQQFLYEWLTYCANPDANGRHPRKELFPNAHDFKEHRTDQAIYTLLARKYEIALQPEASEPGPGYFLQGGALAQDEGRGSKWRNV